MYIFYQYLLNKFKLQTALFTPHRIFLWIICIVPFALSAQHELVVIETITNDSLAQIAKYYEGQGRAYAGYTLEGGQALERNTANESVKYNQHFYVPGANALVFYFNPIAIVKEGRLIVTNLRTNEKKVYDGGQSNVNWQNFSTDIIGSDSVSITLQVNQELAELPKIKLIEMVYDTRGLEVLRSDCQVDAVCAESNNFSDEVNSVVRIKTKEGNNRFWCSGVLLNNATFDCTPYILTALHCAENSQENDYDFFEFYFNFQRVSCGVGSGSESDRLTGCKRIADSNDQGGQSGSDFLLVEINQQIPESYHAFYAGWTRSTSPSGSGVGIHHPSGNEKAISTYTQPLQGAFFGGVGIETTHWRVNWVATANGHGTTEQGSSGSPIFNSKGEVVGTLSGGESGCSNLNGPDFYGKFSYHWNKNPNAANEKLKFWLDPANTNVVNIPGTYFPCLSPTGEDAGIIAIAENGLTCNSAITLSYTLKNFGQETLDRVNIKIENNGEQVASFLEITNLSPGATKQFTRNLNLEEGVNQIKVSTFLPNGITDTNQENDFANSVIFVGDANELTEIMIIPDCEPTEVSFELFSEDSISLATVNEGQIQTGENNFFYCLPEGCYFVRLFDGGGDGLTDSSCGTPGSIEVFHPDGERLASINGNHDVYGSTASFGFCTNADRSLEDLEVKLFPNPMNGTHQLSLQFNHVVLENVVITIYDKQGNLVAESEAFVFRAFTMNTLDLEKGIYTIKLVVDNKKEITEKFIKL